MPSRLVLAAMCLTLIPWVSAHADGQASSGNVEPQVPEKAGKNLRAIRVDRGSTLFLVWNMANSDDSRQGEFSALRDLRTGFTAPGSHVFVAKLSYWFAP